MADKISQDNDNNDSNDYQLNLLKNVEALKFQVKKIQIKKEWLKNNSLYGQILTNAFYLLFKKAEHEKLMGERPKNFEKLRECKQQLIELTAQGQLIKPQSIPIQQVQRNIVLGQEGLVLVLHKKSGKFGSQLVRECSYQKNKLVQKSGKPVKEDALINMIVEKKGQPKMISDPKWSENREEYKYRGVFDEQKRTSALYFHSEEEAQIVRDRAIAFKAQIKSKQILFDYGKETKNKIIQDFKIILDKQARSIAGDNYYKISNNQYLEKLEKDKLNEKNQKDFQRSRFEKEQKLTKMSILKYNDKIHIQSLINAWNDYLFESIEHVKVQNNLQYICDIIFTLTSVSVQHDVNEIVKPFVTLKILSEELVDQKKQYQTSVELRYRSSLKNSQDTISEYMLIHQQFNTNDSVVPNIIINEKFLDSLFIIIITDEITQKNLGLLECKVRNIIDYKNHLKKLSLQLYQPHYKKESKINFQTFVREKELEKFVNFDAYFDHILEIQDHIYDPMFGNKIKLNQFSPSDFKLMFEMLQKITQKHSKVYSYLQLSMLKQDFIKSYKLFKYFFFQNYFDQLSQASPNCVKNFEDWQNLQEIISQMSLKNGLMDFLGDPESQTYLDTTEEYIKGDALNIKTKSNDHDEQQPRIVVSFLYKRDLWEIQEEWQPAYFLLKNYIKKGITMELREQLWFDLSKLKKWVYLTEQKLSQYMENQSNKDFKKQQEILAGIQQNANKRSILYQIIRSQGKSHETLLKKQIFKDIQSILQEKQEADLQIIHDLDMPVLDCINNVMEAYTFWMEIFKDNRVIYSRHLIKLLIKFQQFFSCSETSFHIKNLEEDCFWMLVCLSKQILRSYYNDCSFLKESDSKYHGILSHISILKILIKEKQNDIYKKLEQLGFHVDFYFSDHFLSMFSELFNDQCLFRLWDVIFFQGSSISEQKFGQNMALVAFTILTYNKQQIIQAKSVNQVILIIETFCKLNLQIEPFIDFIYKYDESYFTQTLDLQKAQIKKDVKEDFLMGAINMLTEKVQKFFKIDYHDHIQTLQMEPQVQMEFKRNLMLKQFLEKNLQPSMSDFSQINFVIKQISDRIHKFGNDQLHATGRQFQEDFMNKDQFYQRGSLQTIQICIHQIHAQVHREIQLIVTFGEERHQYFINSNRCVNLSLNFEHKNKGDNKITIQVYDTEQEQFKFQCEILLEAFQYDKLYKQSQVLKENSETQAINEIEFSIQLISDKQIVSQKIINTSEIQQFPSVNFQEIHKKFLSINHNSLNENAFVEGTKIDYKEFETMMMESLQGVNRQDLKKLIQQSFLSQNEEFYFLEFVVTLIIVSNQTVNEKAELFFQTLELFQSNKLAQNVVSEELVIKLLQMIYLKNGGNAKQVSDLYGLTFQSQVPYISKAVFQMNPEKQDSSIDVTGFFQQLQCFSMETKNSKDIFLDDPQILRDFSIHLSHLCDIRKGGILNIVVATDVSIKKTKIHLKYFDDVLQIQQNKFDDETYQNKYDSKQWKQNQHLLVVRNNYQMIDKVQFQNIIQKMPLIEYFLNHGINQSSLEIINTQILEFKVQIDGQDMIKMCLKNNSDPSLDYSEYYVVFNIYLYNPIFDPQQCLIQPILCNLQNDEQFLLQRWKRYDKLIQEQQIGQSKYQAQVWCLEMQNLCYHQSIQQIERKVMLKILEKIINPLEKTFEGTLKDNKKNISRIDGQFWYLCKKFKTVNMNSINYETYIIVDDKTRIIDRKSSVLDNIFLNNKIVSPTFIINYRSRISVNLELVYQNWAIFKYFDLKKQWVPSKLSRVSDSVFQVQFQKYPLNKYLLKSNQVAIAINIIEKQINQIETHRSKVIQSQKLSFMELKKLEFVEYEIEDEEVAFKPLYTISNRKKNDSRHYPISVASYNKDLNDRQTFMSSLQNEDFYTE